MRAISLFSGVGGFEIGFERAGIETVLQAERDPWCLKVLERHWPQTERVTDVRDVGIRHAEQRANGRSERDATGRGPAEGQPWDGIDLVYGGFPCQDLSVAGKRAGLDGERSGLWFEFHRVLRELRPRWAVIENVPGLLSSNEGRDFAVILDGLAELGFDVAWAVLDAQHFGVPQRRRRVFVVAGPTRRACEQVLSVCESCGGNPAPGRAPGQDVAGGITAGVGVAENQRGELRLMDVSPALSSGGGKPGSGYSAVLAAPLGSHHRWDDLDNDTYVLAVRTAQTGANDHGIAQDVAHTLAGATQAVAYALAARESKGVSKYESQTNYVPSPSGVRRLTPLECERLMGWPDDWTHWDAESNEIPDSHRYRMCGNGVVSTVAEWIGHRLMAVDSWA